MEQKHDIEILKGAKYFLLVNLKQEDVAGNVSSFNATGFALRGKIKRFYKSTTSWDFTFNAIDLSVGELEVVMGADITATLPADTLVYDIELYDPADTSTVYKVLYGNVNVVDEVTRS